MTLIGTTVRLRIPRSTGPDVLARAVVERQGDRPGEHWATENGRPSNRGYLLRPDGSVLRQVYRDGEIVSSVPSGLWAEGDWAVKR